MTERTLDLLRKAREALKVAMVPRPKERDALLTEIDAHLQRPEAPEGAQPVVIKRHSPDRHMVGPNDGGMTRIEELADIPVGALLYTTPQPAAGVSDERIRELAKDLLGDWPANISPYRLYSFARALLAEAAQQAPEAKP